MRYFFIENLTYFLIHWSGRKYSHTNSYNFAMTVIAQDDHLTAGAWVACEWRRVIAAQIEEKPEPK